MRGDKTWRDYVQDALEDWEGNAIVAVLFVGALCAGCAIL